MILLIDHQDSFTRNLEHLLAGFDEVLVRDRGNIRDEICQSADLIVLSPGPGNPDQYPETQDIYRSWRGQKPILGICLGFQLILQVEGARITRQAQVLHGVETEIEFDESSRTYAGLPPSLRVARYHSLRVDPATLSNLPDSINITARDPIRDAPLSFEDTKRKIFGLQYHPESFLTTSGHPLIENIRHACMD
jgi:anthranilate synthase component II